MNLQQQTRKVLDEIGIPVSAFCRRMQISDTAFYRWQHDNLQLSENTLNRIKEYVTKLSKAF